MQLVLKMLAAHFPSTYGEGWIIGTAASSALMRVGRDGKMRPDAPAPEVEDQTDELVASADSGDVEPSKMRIGLVLGEPCTSEELERFYGGEQPLRAGRV